MNDNDLEMIQQLRKLKNEHKRGWAGFLKGSQYQQLKLWILEKTPLLRDPKFTWTTKVYWILTGLTDFPKCPICGKSDHMHKNVDHPERGYFRACTKECAAANPERKKKIQQTTFNHFGSTNYFTSLEGKTKRDNWLKKNGVINAFQLESVKQKSNASRKKHFGYEYTMQSPEKRALAKENYKKKTGYDHQFCDPNVIAKVAAKRQEKIVLGIDEKAVFKQNWRKKRYNQLVNFGSEVIPMFSFDEYKNCTRITQYTTPFKWHCNKCGSDFVGLLDPNLMAREHLLARCKKCHPVLCGTSRPELEMIDFIKMVCKDEIVLNNDRKLIYPLEIDCYIPSKKLAFEFDGMFYHSEIGGRKSKFYHLAKTELCAKIGVKLIHIFEDEWNCKKGIVKSRICNLLGKHEVTLFARKCTVQRVQDKVSRNFLTNNHLQGSIRSKVSYGLFYNGDLISLMTFGRNRFSSKQQWELLRFCNKLGYHIPGAASRLLKHFISDFKPISIVSYADRRWSSGKLYEALGFTLDHFSEPNYWYLAPKTLFRSSRMQFQKSKLSSLLQTFDIELTEIENMRANGYDRIFDCGNLVYVKQFRENQ